MKSSFIKITIATLAIVLVAGAAMAQHHWGHGGDDFFGGPMFGFFTEYLDLTDAQQAQIKDMFAKEKPTLEPLFQQEMQSRKDMMQLITSGNFDEGKAQAIATQGAQIHTQLEVQHARIAAQAYQLLTPEQKTKLAQFISKREQRFENRMQEHMQGGQSEQAPN